MLDGLGEKGCGGEKFGQGVRLDNIRRARDIVSESQRHSGNDESSHVQRIGILEKVMKEARREV